MNVFEAKGIITAAFIQACIKDQTPMLLKYSAPCPVTSGETYIAERAYTISECNDLTQGSVAITKTQFTQSEKLINHIKELDIHSKVVITTHGQAQFLLTPALLAPNEKFEIVTPTVVAPTGSNAAMVMVDAAFANASIGNPIRLTRSGNQASLEFTETLVSDKGYSILVPNDIDFPISIQAIGDTVNALVLGLYVLEPTDKDQGFTEETLTNAVRGAFNLFD